MKIYGIDVGQAISAIRPKLASAFRRKDIPLITSDPLGALASTNYGPGGWRRVLEPFTGAWQRNIEIDAPQNLLAFSAVYACLSLISADISKLRMKLVEQDPATKIWTEVSSPAFSPVLRKPNRYQTRIQFLKAWMLSKLIYGNTYVLKERDARGVVIALYVLDPQRVNLRITTDGGVYYQLYPDDRRGLKDGMLMPMSEIIHDRGPCLFHPLIGVPPIFACGVAATQGNRIQVNSQAFFDNLSRPGGVLSAPDEISPETIAEMKAQFEASFSGSNIGRMLVVGNDMTYTAISIPAAQSQLIEQLRWTAEDVARAFRVPVHKLATGQNPTFNNVGALNQDYYSQTLQEDIEGIEILLDEGLGLDKVEGRILGVELDLTGLLRMDQAGLAEVNQKEIKAGYLAPNEARARVNLPPTKGGEEPVLQQQNFPLSVLVQQPPPGSTPAPAPAPPPEPPEDEDEDLREELAQLGTRIEQKMIERLDAANETIKAMLESIKQQPLLPAPEADDEEKALEDSREMAEYLIERLKGATRARSS